MVHNRILCNAATQQIPWLILPLLHPQSPISLPIDVNFHPPPTLIHTHTHTHIQYILAHLPCSARLSKHQTLADSGGSDGSTSSELNQLADLQWGHAVFAGLPGSEGITVSPRPTNRPLHTLQHLLGFGPSLKGMNWICSEWGVMQWSQLDRAAILCRAPVLLFVRPTGTHF